MWKMEGDGGDISDCSASVIGDQESVPGTSVQVVMDKDVDNMDDDVTLNQVASMPYRYCRVSIYQKADRFFYEPIVLLEEVLVSKHQRHDGRVEAGFKIKLWDHDLEQRIITYLRDEVGEAGLKAHQVQVMPYEEVQLVAKKNTSSFRVPSGAVSLLQLPVEVDFEILFSSEDEAELNANVKFLAKHLELHFASPSTRRLQGTAKKARRESAFRVHRRSIFGINIVSQAIGSLDNEGEIAKNTLPELGGKQVC